MGNGNNVERKDLITVKELAYLLRYHPYTIQGLARSGALKGFKIGNRWLFNKKDVLSFPAKEERV